MNRAAHWGDLDPWSTDLWLVRLTGDLEESLVLHVYVQRIAYLLLPWSRLRSRLVSGV